MGTPFNMQGVIIPAICTGAIAVVALSLALLSAAKGRIYRLQHMRFVLACLVVNLVQSLVMTLTVSLPKDGVAEQRAVCGLEFVQAGTSFGQMFAETAILLLARTNIRSGRNSLRDGVELRFLLAGILFMMLSGGGVTYYCTSQCVQPADGSSQQFYDCWQNRMWYHINIIWLAISVVPLVLWAVVFRQVRATKESLSFQFDPLLHSEQDMQRGLQLLTLQDRVITEIYLPIRFYPSLFLAFALLLLVFTVVTKITDNNPAVVAIIYLYPLKAFSVAVVYFWNTPHSLVNLGRALRCYRLHNDPKLRNRHVRIRRSVEVRLIDEEPLSPDVGAGVDYTAFDNGSPEDPQRAVEPHAGSHRGRRDTGAVYIASLNTELIE